MKQKTRLLPLFVCLACVVLTGTPAFAQGGGTTTSLSGSVTDTSGAVIPGATVSVKNNATATAYQAVTNEQGYFTVPAIDPGAYTVTVTLMGFKTAVLNDVRVNASTPATVKVALEVGGVAETVVVTGGSEIIQTQSPAVSATIDTNQILKLPTGSRSALDFVALLPGVNTPGGPGETRDSTVNGLPQSTINITIDGMSAQDNHLKTGDGFFARVSPRLDAIEEVTVSTAAQDAASTGQGAVQIRFVTRSGSNTFSGSSYFYLRHHKLNANSWFNNRDLPPVNGKAPKDEERLYQPGTRAGGPIVIPGLFNGRDRAFFFFNYEESRSPGQNTEDRTVLHPRAEQGFFRYTASGQTREVNVLALAQANNFVSTIDPTIGRLLGDIRNATGQGGLAPLTDPLVQRFTYQYDTKGVTRYPTGRIDVNATDKHRVSWSMNYTDLLSTPDTTNNREPNFPGFPGTGDQISDRYTVQGTLRSTLGTDLVNEFRVGGTGGATLFSPGIGPHQYGDTPVADQGGFLLNINSVGGITNAHTAPTYQGREASTKLVENTLSWLRGTHSIQTGASFTRADVWRDLQTWVPTINFGVASTDPADAIFNRTNFPGASDAQLTEARDLYSMLTGRVISINADQRLNENGEYVFLGRSNEKARLLDIGFFIADTWRWKPTFTLTLGLRYELQSPFYPLNNSYSKAGLAEVWGVSGVGNLFSPGVMTGQRTMFNEYPKGEGAYNWDRNNWAPNVGFAWTLGGQGSILRRILGSEEGDSVLRGGYNISYNRPGMNDFVGTIDDNPGIQVTANRNHTLGNLGTPGGILFRNRSDLGPPPNLPTTRVYPMTDAITEDVVTFEENLQVPYAQTWTAGWQRKLTSNTVVEARYVGTRSLQSWQTYNYNEINIVENGFLNEFLLAQQNLRANIAAGRGSTFAYTGVPGTSPLPILLAYFTGNGASMAGNPASYTGNLWTNSTFRNPLAMHYPEPFVMANALDADQARINNALRAGLPANFLVANPHALGGAEVIGNGGYTKYNSLQLELRKRLSQGLQFQTSYVYGRAYVSDRFSFRTPRAKVLDTGTEGGVTHAFRANWVYELPFGRGRRWGANAGNFMDRLVGGWSLDGIARIQSGTLLDFGNVRLVGLTADELRKAFKLRFDHAGRAVYMLPEDIVENTVRAFDVSATSATGYGDQGPPSGRYLAPPNYAGCLETAQSDVNDPLDGFGDCGVRSLVVTGPTLVRFDLSAVKRVPIAGRVNFEFRAEFLNAFNTPWFEAVAEASDDPDDFRVDDGQSGRQVQLVWRVTW